MASYRESWGEAFQPYLPLKAACRPVLACMARHFSIAPSSNRA